MRARGRVAAAGMAVALLVAGCAPEGGEAEPDTRRSAGWTVTVYYTAVESHHAGDRRVQVTGCPRLECTRGDADLGRYPAGFVAAVEAEGTGRIVHGRHAGEYLNWSHGVGYWLDTAPRDSYGRPLEPFVSAAADADVLPKGSRVRIRACGTEENGEPVNRRACERLSAAEWQVRDEFTPGLGGERHLDVYLGEATGPGFTESPLYATLTGAVLELPS